MYVFVLEAFERPIAKATDASHIVVRRPVSGCEFKGNRLFRRPQFLFFFRLWDYDLVGLCDLEIVRLRAL